MGAGVDQSAWVRTSRDRQSAHPRSNCKPVHASGSNFVRSASQIDGAPADINLFTAAAEVSRVHGAKILVLSCPGLVIVVRPETRSSKTAQVNTMMFLSIEVISNRLENGAIYEISCAYITSWCREL